MKGLGTGFVVTMTAALAFFVGGIGLGFAGFPSAAGAVVFGGLLAPVGLLLGLIIAIKSLKTARAAATIFLVSLAVGLWFLHLASDEGVAYLSPSVHVIEVLGVAVLAIAAIVYGYILAIRARKNTPAAS